MSRKKRFQVKIKQRMKRHQNRLKIQKDGKTISEFYYGGHYLKSASKENG